ncbi:MAG: alpha/beta fold hydrolase [Lautropia sp.]
MSAFDLHGLRVGDYDIHFVDEGKGPPLLLIHGLAGDHTAWAPQIEAWRGAWRVIAPDTRGAGKSTQVDEPVTIEALAADFVQLLDLLKIDRCHVIGRSMGGAIGQCIALQAPERVASLVTIGSFAKLDPRGRRALEMMREVLEWTGSWGAHGRHSIGNFVSAEFFNKQPDKVAAIEALIAGTQRLQACYIHQNHACIRYDNLSRLREIRTPTLVMSGGQDPICGPLATQWLVNGLPNVESVEFADGAHFFFMEEPERFMKLMHDWLARHTPGADSARR